MASTTSSSLTIHMLMLFPSSLDALDVTLLLMNGCHMFFTKMYVVFSGLNYITEVGLIGLRLLKLLFAR